MSTTILLGPATVHDDGRGDRALPRLTGPRRHGQLPAGRSARPTTPSSPADLDGRGVNLRLLPPDARRAGQGPSTSPRRRSRFRDRMDELRAFYGIRLQAAIDAVYAVAPPHVAARRRPGRRARPRSRPCATSTGWYAGELDRAVPLDAEPPRAPRRERRHRAGTAARSARSSTSARRVVIAGGNVAHPAADAAASSTSTLRPEQPVVAWSAGAMALTDQVVLFHDFAPQGVTAAEVLRPRARPGAAASSPCRTPGGACSSTTATGCRSWRGGSPSAGCLLLDDGAVVRFRRRRDRPARGRPRHRRHRPRRRVVGAA